MEEDSKDVQEFLAANNIALPPILNCRPSPAGLRLVRPSFRLEQSCLAVSVRLI